MRLLSCLAMLCSSTVLAQNVAISVDGTSPQQALVGFGATTVSLAFGAVDNVPPSLRVLANQAAFEQIKLNTGNLEIEPSEASPSNVFAPANDDDDPLTLNDAGFNWLQSENMFQKVVQPGRPKSFRDFWLGPLISTNFALSFANTYKSPNPSRYLAELAEHVFAVLKHWKDTYGIDQPLVQLWNEPTSGNGELTGGTQADLVAIVKACGARLKAEGFATKFVVPAQETENISLADATAILSDPEARKYVGAIAYHPYPYGSTYAAIPNILSTSGSGAPSPAKVQVRNQLRTLGQQYGVPVFMVEVSHGELAFTDFNALRGRAIHIHDEFEYANASAFFGMNMFWDTVSHAQHYQGRADPGFWSEGDTMVLIDVDAGTVNISPMGRAVGHFARFVSRGAVRLPAASSDPLVLATAFRDSSAGRQVVVAINNANAPRVLKFSFTGLALSGQVTGEQSTAAMAWAALAPVSVTSESTYTVTVPAMSVTSLSVALAGFDAGSGLPDAGAVSDAGQPSIDAGNSIDAGVGIDAGVVDAGSKTVDAGQPDSGAISDAGAVAIDSTSKASGQCGCEVSPGFAAAAIALAALRRRKASSKEGQPHRGRQQPREGTQRLEE